MVGGISTLTGAATAATVLFVSATVDAFLDEYIRRYAAGDVRGVTNLCHVPFLAVRRGEAIHMPDSGAVWDHFAAAIGAYRPAAGGGTRKPPRTPHPPPRRQACLLQRGRERSPREREGSPRNLDERPP